MTCQFVIEGGGRLDGDYQVQGNKNAALPLIAAALLARRRVTLHNTPRIVDVENMLRLIEPLGVSVHWNGTSLCLDTSCLLPGQLDAEVVDQLRGAILLLGPLASLWGEVSCALPGGCPIGRRSFAVHWSAFRAAGFSVREDRRGIELRRTGDPRNPRVYLEESSVTATENALLLFAALGGGLIENPAREPHVLSLVDFLGALGCRIGLHPLYFRVGGQVGKRRSAIEFEVPGDYIDAGTIAIAAAVTSGRLRLRGVGERELMGIRPVLEKFGMAFTRISEAAWEVSASGLSSPSQVTAGPWPLFPTDLVSLAIILATQSAGLCLVHDWMYEARMFFVDKLVRMGGRVTMCDPHRVLVEGNTRLQGTRLESPDIRAGMALVVAGLCAEGTTRIEHAEVIKRGYQDVVERLGDVGAEIREE
ncbi:MAG: UDP-N-acetylglucosamine 1-carboxyvinyltransferase [Acidobacteriota bacterium]